MKKFTPQEIKQHEESNLPIHSEFYKEIILDVYVVNGKFAGSVTNSYEDAGELGNLIHDDLDAVIKKFKIMVDSIGRGGRSKVVFIDNHWVNLD